MKMTFSHVLMKEKASKLLGFNGKRGWCKTWTFEAARLTYSVSIPFPIRQKICLKAKKWEKNRMRTGPVSAGQGTLTSLNQSRCQKVNQGLEEGST